MSAKKIDRERAKIRALLRERGYAVFDAHGLGHGYPDLHVSKDGLAVLVEIKSEDGDLTPAEWEFQVVAGTVYHRHICWIFIVPPPTRSTR